MQRAASNVLCRDVMLIFNQRIALRRLLLVISLLGIFWLWRINSRWEAPPSNVEKLQATPQEEPQRTKIQDAAPLPLQDPAPSQPPQPKTIKLGPPKLIVIGQGGGGSKIAASEPPEEPKAAILTCNIPKLSLNNSEIAPHLKPATPLNCRGEALWLRIDEANRLVWTQTAKDRGLDASNTNCNVSFYSRVNDNRLKWQQIKEFDVGSIVDVSENMHVSCQHKHKRWKHLFMNLVPSDAAIKRARQAERPKDWSGLNVFILGFDSLSQQSFRRNLPLTVEYLENTMDAIVLNGYNAVGDGTPQAFIPILTAATEEELPMTRKRVAGASYVDVYPWIWRNFSSAGYATTYGEDAAEIGTFTYRLKGFKQQPTDHYTRTYFQFAERFLKNWRCNGPVPQHQDWFEYASNFMRKYPRDVPKFLLMHHSMLSHDAISQVSNADEDLRSLLKRLNDDSFFNDTLVIVLADHGHRYSELRSTQQGQLEERLPFFSVSLPRKFRATPVGAAIYEELQANKERLTSPFDVHATLVDVLRLPTLEQVRAEPSLMTRSLSMFRRIPKSRTCDQAGIASHWQVERRRARRFARRLFSVCINDDELLASGARASRGSRRSASRVFTKRPSDSRAPSSPRSTIIRRPNANYALSSNSPSFKTPNGKSKCFVCRQCKFALFRLVPEENMLRYSGARDIDGFVPKLDGNTTVTFSLYQLRFSTSPGRAVYDATVEFDANADNLKIDFRAISHINQYGDDPHCIIDKNYFLATYCVCHDRV